jgi:N-methylhydantoinase B/oxoprolinase/acetone carboxylase alpha subunit
LDKESARKALRKIADKLELSIEEAAQAVFTTVSSNMADGITEITTRRGYDVREFSLLACGGGGAGVGDPADRDPEEVRMDVKNELVSIEKAMHTYKVIIDPETLEVDRRATESLRDNSTEHT